MQRSTGWNHCLIWTRSRNRLFTQLYLDEDVDVLIVALLRARGFSATTTPEANNTGADDLQQPEFAASRGMTLVTHNRVDFEQLVAEFFSAGKNHAGVIIPRVGHRMRLGSGYSPFSIAIRLMRWGINWCISECPPRLLLHSRNSSFRGGKVVTVCGAQTGTTWLRRPVRDYAWDGPQVSRAGRVSAVGYFDSPAREMLRRLTPKGRRAVFANRESVIAAEGRSQGS